MFSRLFRRKREPEDPKVVAEQARQKREAEKFRRQAEVDQARQRSEVENYLPGPP
jgi:hypothetical protein